MTSNDSASGSAGSSEPVFSIRGLTVEFRTASGLVRAVDGVSYEVKRGEIAAVVGESGSGKTVTVMAALRLLAASNGQVVAGEVYLHGRDLFTLKSGEVRALLGREVAMVFQDPAAAFNPVFRVGDQIRETLLIHNPKWSRRQAKDRTIELMELVGIAAAPSQYIRYPHEFSGGMAQRAIIAMAIANRPRVLVADEPTSSLDVTIQAQLLDLLRTVVAETGTAIILITHNFGVVAELADSVKVMYAGRVVETADVWDLFRQPAHPYTQALLECIPHVDATRPLLPIPGTAPDPAHLPLGCPFHPRCFLAEGRPQCAQARPLLRQIGLAHMSACHFAEELISRGSAASTVCGLGTGRRA